jgi:hypothetical protein
MMRDAIRWKIVVDSLTQNLFLKLKMWFKETILPSAINGIYAYRYTIAKFLIEKINRHGFDA